MSTIEADFVKCRKQVFFRKSCHVLTHIFLSAAVTLTVMACLNNHFFFTYAGVSLGLSGAAFLTAKKINTKWFGPSLYNNLEAEGVSELDETDAVTKT